jgi:hypothetical protein
MSPDQQLAAQRSGADANSDRDDPAWMWLIRGWMAGVLVLGSANALSFFFRSRGWGSLLGDREFGDEAIGFPMIIWQEGNGYGSHVLKVTPFVVDIAAAILLGTLVGLATVSQRRTLNKMMARFRRQSAGGGMRLQFSLRGLLVTTVLAAIAAGAARVFTPRVEVLAAIYALGPLALIVLAYLPRRLSWQQRVAILTPSALVLIAVAITLGTVLEVEFDKVLMGIFICWTPQAALGAVALTAWILLREYRAIKLC